MQRPTSYLAQWKNHRMFPHGANMKQGNCRLAVLPVMLFHQSVPSLGKYGTFGSSCTGQSPPRCYAIHRPVPRPRLGICLIGRSWTEIKGLGPFYSGCFLLPYPWLSYRQLCYPIHCGGCRSRRSLAAATLLCHYRGSWIRVPCP
jgi:hypothetical protein